MHPRIAVTGGTGAISYSLLFRLASGALFGNNQPISLYIHDIKSRQSHLQGVKMELQDCGFPLLKYIKVTTSYSEAFDQVDYAFLVGGKAQAHGEKRVDLLVNNAGIFRDEGKALNDHAKRTCKTIIVGNPVNTNCLVTSHYAKDIPIQNFSALTRLDHNRSINELAQKFKSHSSKVKHLTVWGNHASSMYPDINQVLINGKHIRKYSDFDQTWYRNVFIPKVQERAAEIMEYRGATSAASAASAAIDHMINWIQPSGNQWYSMGVISNNNPYKIPEGIIFSFPCKVLGNEGKLKIVQDLSLDDQFSQIMIKNTVDDLLKEREMVDKIMN